MAKKRTPDSSSARAEAIQRRDALKKLGALAICAPTLASMACDDDPDAPDTGVFQGGAEAGVGGNPGGMLDAGGGTTGSGTATTGGGAAGGGTTGGGTPGNGGTAGGGTTGGGTTGGSTGGTAGGADAGMGSLVDAGAGDAGAASAGFFPPMFQDAPTCSLTCTDPAGEGPFFIHETEVMNDPVLIRTDMRDGQPGVELQLHLRLLDITGGCMTPIKDVDVYVWHTDALGLYSGFTGQNPDVAYMGGPTTPGNLDRFCRGIQVTDSNGVVSFRTVYPGWYFRRPLHIHFVALRKGSGPAASSYQSAQYHMFTTQMYFDEAFSKNIHENNAPYMARVRTNGYADWIKPDPMSQVRPSTRMEGNVAVASLNIITNSMRSRGATGFTRVCT